MRYFRTEENTGFKYIHSKDDKVIYIENETADAPQFSIQYGDKLLQIFINDGIYRPERDITGTPDLFSLSYNSESNDKGQSILVTQAEINVYEDEYFNIDNLKTSNETEILIKYFESGVLFWQGFVLPDFLQTDISAKRVLQMIATDRIGTLKDRSNQTSSNTPIKIIAEALSNTGLTLPINVIAKNDYLQTTIIERERIKDISSYDLIRSFMILFNCKIVQYKSAWWIINKSKLESGYIDYKSYDTNGVFINDIAFNQKQINVGAVYLDGQREIKPTASEVSLFLEFGGSKKYPENWDFEEWNGTKFEGWESVNGFVQRENRKVIDSYSVDAVTGDINANLGTNELEDLSLWNRNRGFFHNFPGDEGNYITKPHLKSTFSNIPFIGDKAEVEFKANFTSVANTGVTIVPLIKIVGSNVYYAIDADGSVKKLGSTVNLKGVMPTLLPTSQADVFEAVQSIGATTFKFDRRLLGIDNEAKAELQVLLFGSSVLIFSEIKVDMFIHSLEIEYNKSEVTGKGLIFKTKQGGDKFSKVREPETVLFSDKINQGVNGYFYNYKYDDTSIVTLPNEFALASVRERALMFSQARDYYTFNGKLEVNPLAKYTCGTKSFVLVGGVSGRKDASLTLEEIATRSLTSTDYIYTYFDNGKDKVDTIKGVGSASSGGSSSSGGGASLIKIDENGDYYVEENFYSLKNVSAYGLGEEGGSGGGAIDIVDNLTTNEGNKALSARQGMILDNKISNIEVGEGGQVVVDWDAILAKPTTFAPAPHTHVMDDITNLQGALDLKADVTLLDGKENTFTKNTAFNKNFGTGLNDVARGNHTHAFSQLTATPTTLQGYGITDAALLSEFDSFKQLFDSIFEVDSAGNIKALKSFYSVGNVSAYGLGEGGSGGSGSIDVINSLISTSTNQALSANQGRMLNENKADKTEVSSLAFDKVDKVTGKSLVDDTEITRLSTVVNQDLTPYAKTVDVNKKVDKVSGKSLIADTEITRLASVTNQDISGKADTSFVNTELNKKVDKVSGKSLIADTEITRLASVVNQTKASLGLDLVANKNLSNVDNIQQASKVNFDAHTANKLNPHAVTKDQVGLGNVSNVLQASKNEFDANKSTTDVHIANKLNPHQVTAFQVGLGNVTNNLQATKAEFDNFVTLFNQMFEIEGNVIKAKKTLYSVGNISAYGQGTGGTGGAFDMIYNGLDSSVTDVAGSANNDFVLNNKIASLENRTLTTVSGSVEYQEINIE